MVIFFVPSTTGAVTTRQAIVLLDDTRSDDSFSRGTIDSLAQQAAGKAKVVLQGRPLVFSLNYSVLFKQSAIKLEDSIKPFSQITVSNAPPALSNLIKVSQLAAQQTVMSLQNATEMVVEAQKVFPWAMLIFPPANMSIFPGSSASLSNYITKLLVVYETDYNFDNNRLGSTLRIKMGAFDSLVMRLNFEFMIEKTLPLASQISAKVASQGYTVEADAAIAALPPVIEKLYTPATLNSIMWQIGKDNGVFIGVNVTDKKIVIKSAASNNPPEASILNVPKFCFRGKKNGAYLIGGFGIQDYVTARVESELVPVEIFDTVQLFNDTGDEQLFQNFSASIVPVMRSDALAAGAQMACNFYILELAIMQDRSKTTLEFIGTSNWILSNFRLGYFFENAIYTTAQAQL